MREPFSIRKGLGVTASIAALAGFAAG